MKAYDGKYLVAKCSRTSIKLSWVPPEHGFSVPPSSPDLFLYSLILEPMKTSILQHFSKSVQPAFGRGHQGPRHLHDSLHFHFHFQAQLT